MSIVGPGSIEFPTEEAKRLHDALAHGAADAQDQRRAADTILFLRISLQQACEDREALRDERDKLRTRRAARQAG